MRPLDSILRVLLVLLVGCAPLLCCCGTAEANVTNAATPRVDDSAAHGCCVAEENAAPVAPAPTGGHDCGCDSTSMAMQKASAEAATVLPPAVELPTLQRAPLSWPLAGAILPPAIETQPIPAFADAAVRPAAPTLRTLHVLLLT